MSLGAGPDLEHFGGGAFLGLEKADSPRSSKPMARRFCEHEVCSKPSRQASRFDVRDRVVRCCHSPLLVSRSGRRPQPASP